MQNIENFIDGNYVVTDWYRSSTTFDFATVHKSLFPFDFNIMPFARLPLKCSIVQVPEPKLNVRWDIRQLPSVYKVITAVEDSFVREDVPRINYSDAAELFVGHFNGAEYKALIKFNFDQLDEGLNFTQAKLALNFNNPYNNPLKLKISKAVGEWDEHGITWMNKPNADEEIITIEVNRGGEYEIDVMSIFLRWYNQNEVNDGFIIETVEIGDGGQRIFSSESMLGPELRVEYEIPIPPTPASSWIDYDFIVKRRDPADVRFNFNVKSYFKRDNLPFEMTIRLPWEIPFDFMVSNHNFSFDFGTTYPDNSIIGFELKVQENRAKDSIFKFDVSTKFIPLNFTVRQTDISKAEFDFLVKCHEKENLLFTAEVARRWIIPFEFTVPLYFADSTLGFDFIVRQKGNSKLNFNFTICRTDPSDTLFAFDVVHQSLTPFDMYVNSPYVPFDLVIPHKTFSNRHFFFGVRRMFINDLEFNFMVGKPITHEFPRRFIPNVHSYRFCCFIRQKIERWKFDKNLRNKF